MVSADLGSAGKEITATQNSALLRRSAVQTESESQWFKFGDIRIDLAHARVFRAGARVALSDREFALLRYLIDHRGSAVSHERLLVDVWGIVRR